MPPVILRGCRPGSRKISCMTLASHRPALTTDQESSPGPLPTKPTLAGLEPIKAAALRATLATLPLNQPSRRTKSLQALGQDLAKRGNHARKCCWPGVCRGLIYLALVFPAAATVGAKRGSGSIPKMLQQAAFRSLTDRFKVSSICIMPQESQYISNINDRRDLI